MVKGTANDSAPPFNRTEIGLCVPQADYSKSLASAIAPERLKQSIAPLIQTFSPVNGFGFRAPELGFSGFDFPTWTVFYEVSGWVSPLFTHSLTLFFQCSSTYI